MSPTADTRRGRLFLVPTPLDFGVTAGAERGDLQEVLPLGVIRRAASLTHWIAENAKTARAFLKRVDTVVPLALPLQSLSILELPRPVKGVRVAAAPILDALLAPALAGSDVGLVSEAGLAAVADPGAAIVQAAHRLGIEVVPLPGASSLLLALAASGLEGQSFAFVGYLPQDAAQRAARLKDLQALSRRAAQTQLLIETPYRNAALLRALLDTLDADTRLSVSCGLSLPEGWTRSQRIADWRPRPPTMPDRVPAVFAFLAG